MKLTVLLIFIFFFVFFSYPIEKYPMPSEALQKANTIISKHFEGKKIKLEPIPFSDENAAKLTFKIMQNQVLRVTENDNLLGYIYFSDGESFQKKYYYLVIFEPNLSISSCSVTFYEDTYGEQIGKEKWLSQFAGKNAQSSFEYGSDIDAISGSTISAKSITEGIFQLCKNMQELKEKHLI